MKTRFYLGGTLASLLLLGCSTPDARIRDQQAAFAAYPADVQQKIRAGQVEVGFTAEQARMALGEPARTYSRITEQGQAEVWAYRSKAPALSFGVGVGGGGGSTRVGGGVGVSTGDRREDRLRLVFRDGRVAAVEQVSR